MTTDRDFDRIAAAWLADGPAELSDRVLDAAIDEIHLTPQRHGLRLRLPWRFPTMTMPVRIGAIVALGALVLAGAMALGGAGFGRTTTIPSQAPASAPAAVVPSPTEALASGILSTSGVPVLDTLFTSPRNGYSVRYPAGWTATPGTQSWPHGKPILWGDPAMDAIQTSDARFVAAAQKLAASETADQWFKAYCLGSAEDTGQCDTVPGSWEPVKMSSSGGAGMEAYIDLDGPAAQGGTIVPGGKVFDAVAVAGDTAYAFTLDGDVDRPMFDAFMSTVHLYPGSLISLPELTKRFTSPMFGYSVGVAPDWTTEPATQHWRGLSNDVLDGITITGTDSGFGGASQPLGSQTFDEFLAAYHTKNLASVPAGCDGGDPSKWPEIQIGDKTGRLQNLCNAADAFVEAGGRVYIFEWGSESFDTSRHLSLASWKELLTSVALDPASAKK